MANEESTRASIANLQNFSCEEPLRNRAGEDEELKNKEERGFQPSR